MMLKDMYGEVVSNGDFMAEGNEDHAYIFQIQNNKPILVGLAILDGGIEKFSLNNILENDKKLQKGIEEGTIPSFLKDYHKTTYNRLSTIKSESLCKTKDNQDYELLVK